MIYIFLPAYNEEIALRRVVQKIDTTFKEKSEPYKIVVVDDGSTDKTPFIAKALESQYPMVTLSHSKNMGLGQTMIDGLHYIAKESQPNDLIVSLDCDDTHEPQYLPSAFQKIRAGYDVVILSRFEEGGREEGLSWYRKLLSHGACLFLKIFFPIRGIQDYSCNFRVFRASIIKKAFEIFGNQFIRLPHLGFVVASEILIKLRMLHCRMTESPFVLKYDQKPGKSKNNTSRTIWGYFALVILYWGRNHASAITKSPFHVEHLP